MDVGRGRALANKHPLHDITEEEIRAFESDGVLRARGVLDEEWIVRMRAAVDDILEHPTEFGHDLSEEHEDRRYAIDNNMWMFHPEFRAFIYESPMAETAAMFLRSGSVNLVFDFLLVEEPHTPTHTTWHQDMPGNPVEGNACGMWVSLDHVTAQNGAVQWARGSHKWGKRYDPVGDGSGKYEGYGYLGDAPILEKMPDIAGNPDKYNIVSFETDPDDFIVSSLLICHGAAGNASSRRRRALGVRFAGEGSTYEVRTDVSFNLGPGEDPGMADGEPFPETRDHNVFPRLGPDWGSVRTTS